MKFPIKSRAHAVLGEACVLPSPKVDLEARFPDRPPDHFALHFLNVDGCKNAVASIASVQGKDAGFWIVVPDGEGTGDITFERADPNPVR